MTFLQRWVGIVDRCPLTMDIEEYIAILQYQKNGTKVAKTKRANIKRSMLKKQKGKNKCQK